MKKNTDERWAYQKRLELGIIIALCLFIMLVIVTPKKYSSKTPDIFYINKSLINIDMPPITKHRESKPPPILPQIPMLSEDDLLPSEATIEETLLDLSLIEIPDAPDPVPFDGYKQIVFSETKKCTGEVKPRRKSGKIILALLVDQHGRVDSLYVVKNPGNDKQALSNAIYSAYRTLFVDERPSKKKIRWIQKKF